MASPTVPAERSSRTYPTPNGGVSDLVPTRIEVEGLVDGATWGGGRTSKAAGPGGEGGGGHRWPGGLTPEEVHRVVQGQGVPRHPCWPA